MLKKIKSSSIKLSIVAALAVSPFSLYAASAGGMIEGSSESSSAMIEDPGFEKQIVRINTGINLIRINTDILESMPVSQDSEWVDKVVSAIDYATVNKLDAVKYDAYYSTVNITNLILRKPASIRMSPLEARLFWQASALYKNSTNGNTGFNLPNMNVFPDISNTKTYTSFKSDSKVAFIDVEAASGNLYKNVEDAVISLLPEDLQEAVSSAKSEYITARDELGSATSNVKAIDAWLDDDANAQSGERADKEAELATATVLEEEREAEFENKENIYFELIASGAEAIESNFDESKVPLAKKLVNLLDAVDNNAFGAISMFASATAGMTRGYGMIDKELKAMTVAQGLTSLVGNQKEFIGERLSRLGVGTLLALPNIFIGSYYAGSQSSKIGKYQDIVNAVLSGAEA